jgi:malate synthase A
VFEFSEDWFDIPRGSIRATVIVEHINAVYEMDEILHALGPHAAGLTAGRWDYLFSIAREFRHRPDFVLPDRSELTMDLPFMRAYTELLIRTCHRRGAHALGGVSTQIPDRHDAEARARAIEAVRRDKEREAVEGFDGTWVVHPDLVAPLSIGYSSAAHIKSSRQAVDAKLRPRCSRLRTASMPRSPNTACVPTSRSRSAIWKRGCAAADRSGCSG